MINIYQVLPRLYGNKGGANVTNGSIAENGCGKMADFNIHRLRNIHRDGYTHIWYTGLLEHATQTRYNRIPCDNPSIVKGRAGSPYAVKDYYDIDPDLAIIPNNRLQEFRELLERTHKAGLKFIMDFIPNHVARQYNPDSKPQAFKGSKKEDFAPLGKNDDTSVQYAPNNNFYYCPGEALHLDNIHITSNGLPYIEFPAKVTGNDRFDAWPGQNDWYETVKLNYGGGQGSSTWNKMTQILLYWANEGVDAFRCDMAEMVPVDFWSYAIAQVKYRFPHVQFIAEVYNPDLYRSYIHDGGFDYLYDKVGMYDTLRAIMTQNLGVESITRAWQSIDDIRSHMLYFLENHDEQRIASDFFAKDPQKAIPAMAVLSFMGTNPLMVYAGQELGERGMDAEGFSGCDGRTTIFDYWCVETLEKMAEFYQHPTKELNPLHAQYRQLLLDRCKLVPFKEGCFYDLMYCNQDIHRQYCFIRGRARTAVLVVANFEDNDVDIKVNIPEEAASFIAKKGARVIPVHVKANSYIVTKI